MTRRWVAAVLFFIAVVAAAVFVGAPIVTRPDSIAIDHVTVIDPSAPRFSSARSADQTIVVSGNRIVEVSDSATIELPDNVRRIDGAGLYAIPGMIDAHVHFNASRRSVERNLGPLMIANGVTAVRDMFSDCFEPCVPGLRTLSEMQRLQRRIENGAVLVPRLLAMSSPLVHGSRVDYFYPSERPSYWQPSSAEEAAQLVAFFEQRGVDFIKTYESIPRAAYFAMIAEARSRGIDVAGHVPRSVTPLEAAEAGARSIEHARWPLLACAHPEAYETYRKAFEVYAAADTAAAEPPWLSFLAAVGNSFDEGACTSMVSALAETDVYLVPTHVTREGYVRADDPEYRADPRRIYVPRYRLQSWDQDLERTLAAMRDVPGLDRAYEAILQNGLRITGMAHEAGVRILVGTDTPSTMVFPGFSYHDEMQHLADAGLDPLAVLRAATYEAAAFLDRVQDFGTISEGKIADFVLLDADPLVDIGNVQRISAVVYNGRFHDRPALDEILSTVKSEAAAQ